jgi:prophage maintenance system killer protein
VLNGRTLHFEPADAIATMLALAAGELPEEALAAWFRERLVG